MNNTTIIESFKWITPEFTVAPTDGKTVKIRGKAIPRETISRNNKKYVDEELRKAARTFIDVPITENHKPYLEKRNQLGKVNWMEYDDGSMEYVAEVWNPEMVAELRAYAKNPKASKVKGVSVEADFLKIACTKCHCEFLTEVDWRKHMESVERIHDLPLEPHGIRGRALSIVTGIESPGVLGNTLEVLETVSPLLRLLETVIKSSMEKEKMQSNTLTTSNTGPPYTVKENIAPPVIVATQKETDLKKEYPMVTSLPEIETRAYPNPPALYNVLEAASEKSKAIIEKLTVKEEMGKFDFDACLASGKSEEECASMAKEKREAKEYRVALTAKVNELAVWVNSYKAPEDDKSWSDKIKEVTGLLETKFTSVASDLVTLANSVKGDMAKLSETVSAIKPYDDTPLRESLNNEMKAAIGVLGLHTQKLDELAAIKPYDDSMLKEKTTLYDAFVTSQKTQNETLFKDITETKQTLQENLAQTTQKQLLIESTYKDEISKLRETVEKQLQDNFKVKETFEKLLDKADKNITEVKKTLEAREKELTEQLEKQNKELNETKNKLQETTTLAENTNDKLQPSFKGKAKGVVKDSSVPSSFNPYK